MHLYSEKPLSEHQKGKMTLKELQSATTAPLSFPNLGALSAVGIPSSL